MANPEHLAILAQGVEAWNKWRDEDPRIAPDLIGADLNSRKLPKFDLRLTMLKLADLSGAKLNGANLADAYLSQANLINADLSDADLTFVNLAHAQVRGAIQKTQVLCETIRSHFGGA